MPEIHPQRISISGIFSGRPWKRRNPRSLMKMPIATLNRVYYIKRKKYQNAKIPLRRYFWA
jgi:hypothetical protein